MSIDRRRGKVGASLIIGTLLTSLVSASDVGDSLRYKLESDASSSDRAKVMIDLAQGAMEKDPASALKYATHALRFAEQSGLLSLEHSALVQKRDAQLRSGLLAEHLRTTIRALEVAKTMGTAEMVALDLQALATAYRLNMRMDKAVDEARNALALVLPTKEGARIRQAQRFLLRTLIQAKRYPEAMALGNKALSELEHASKDLMEEARFRALMAKILLAEHKQSDALPLLVSAHRSISMGGSADELIDVELDLARAAIGMKRFEQVGSHVQNARDLVGRSGSHQFGSQLSVVEYELAAARGDWKNALVLLQRINQEGDSIRESGLDRVLVGMQVMYELDEQAKANSDLRDINASNTVVISDQRAHNRYLIGAAVALLILSVAMFIVSRYSLRMMRRSALKGLVIQKQKDEIHVKNMELQRQNMRLAETLMSEEGKDLVIKEIHHRVKNNLQVIDSLLNLQCGGIDDPAVVRLLKDGQARIRAMASVHEAIYSSVDTQEVDLGRHLQRLARSILVAHGKHDSISVVVEAMALKLSVEELMPLSLVVNELLTNTVKHAFEGRSSGSVRIIVRPAGSHYELLFSDDGVGSTMDTLDGKAGSFGMELVQILATQLNGEVRRLKGTGTNFSMTFSPLQPLISKAS